MEKNNFENENQQTEIFKTMIKNRNRGKIIGGLFVTGIGIVLLFKEMGFFLPNWILSWPMLLIILGLYIGIKHKFKKISWLVLVLIGTSFLARNFFPQYDISTYTLPIILIIVGMYVIVKPKSKCIGNRMRFQHYRQEQ